MLSKPEHGWSSFQLEETSTYDLSYLTDLPFLWLDQAILGLSTLSSFQVEGCLEPGSFSCTVNLTHCEITVQTHPPRNPGTSPTEYSSTGMISFCRQLHDDISCNAGEWACFAAGSVCTEQDTAYRRKKLLQKLNQLDTLLLKYEHRLR